MSSSELKIKLSTIRTVSWSLFQFILSFGMVSCTNHWTEADKFFPAERPLCPSTIIIFVWDATALFLLNKWSRWSTSTTVWQTATDCKNLCMYRCTHMPPCTPINTHRNWKVRLILTMHTVNQEMFITAVCKQLFKKLQMSQIHFKINTKLLNYTLVLLSGGSITMIQASNYNNFGHWAPHNNTEVTAQMSFAYHSLHLILIHLSHIPEVSINTLVLLYRCVILDLSLMFENVEQTKHITCGIQAASSQQKH